MPRIDELDPNFKPVKNTADDAEFFDCMSDPFRIHGLFKPKEQGKFMRLPAHFSHSDEIGESIHDLMFHTAGGRVRFVTDSPYISIKASLSSVSARNPKTSDSCVYGFDMYASTPGSHRAPDFKCSFLPFDISEENTSFEGFHDFHLPKLREITINFPLYSAVDQLMIGVKKGSQLLPPTPYGIESPVVFYGSSVTQGACSSRPGICYTNILSRWLDCDIINLGFSGSDQGEQALAKHIASLDMSAFVHGYAYNAQSIAFLESTYYPFYKTIRESNPTLPIIMMTSPVSLNIKEDITGTDLGELVTDKRAVIMKAYLKALSEGDKNVYFVDGFSLLGTVEAIEGTVDRTHPTDLGFYNMAKTLYPVLNYILR